MGDLVVGRVARREPLQLVVPVRVPEPGNECRRLEGSSDPRRFIAHGSPECLQARLLQRLAMRCGPPTRRGSGASRARLHWLARNTFGELLGKRFELKRTKKARLYSGVRPLRTDELAENGVELE